MKDKLIFFDKYIMSNLHQYKYIVVDVNMKLQELLEFIEERMNYDKQKKYRIRK